MSATMEKTLRELAVENPAATRVFEKLRLDYCCGGSQTLQKACDQAGLSLGQVLDSLEEAGRGASAARPQRNWNAATLAELTEHIRETHHRYTRDEIARLGPLFDKVCSAHGERHRELIEMRDIFAGLADELTNHMMKEERILFPFIERMEVSVAATGRAPQAPFGTVQNPIAMMLHEHDSAGEALRILRSRSGGYAAPADACLSFQTLYKALADFEADLHEHIHLENNILFPRAVEMESR